MSIIYWNGKSTNGNLKWKDKADNFTELFNNLMDKEIIKNYDVDIYDKAVLVKYNKTVDDPEFCNEDGEFDYDKITDFVKIRPLTDKELWELIFEQKGKVYYQSFKRMDGNILKEIDTDDFDKNGNYKY